MSDLIVLKGAAASAYRKLPETFRPAFAELVDAGMTVAEISELVTRRGIVQASKVAERLRQAKLRRTAKK